MPARLALAFCACLLAFAAAPASAFAAGKLTVASSLSEINEVRADYGLTPLDSDDDTSQLVVNQMAAETSWQPRTFEALRLGAQVYCDVCESLIDSQTNEETTPGEMYAALGGIGVVATGLWREGWTIEQEVALQPETLRLALDPRATALAVARSATGVLAIVMIFDPATPAAPLLWPRGGRLDPAAPELLLLSTRSGSAKLSELRGNERVTIAEEKIEVTDAQAAVARILTAGERFRRVSLAWDGSYLLSFGSWKKELRSVSLPQAFVSSSWSLSMASSSRSAFLGAFRSRPPLLQKIVRQLDGSLRVTDRAKALCGQDGISCAGASPGAGLFIHLNTAHLRSARSASFVSLHEFGHIVNFVAIDERAMGTFAKAFRRSPRWKSCFHYYGGCVPPVEIFADQFAFWATGDTDVRSGYNVPQLLSHAAFEKLLKDNYRPRASSYFGPKSD